jgi:hypothetical protein
MKKLESIKIIDNHGAEKCIELYLGNLAAPNTDIPFDLLVTSAFPNCYSPNKGTLIGSLYEAGVSVQELFESKAIDLRANFSSWISGEISQQVIGVKPWFKRLLCFEHMFRGEAEDLVNGIFQAIMPYVLIPPQIKTIAMPVVASGNQGQDSETMFRALLKSSIYWLQMGMPVEKIIFVEINESKVNLFQKIFKDIIGDYIPNNNSIRQNYQYDLFFSYSHNNKAEVDYVHRIVKSILPDIRVFIDRSEIEAGQSWQDRIFSALENSKRIITFYSPDYLSSAICKQEYNVAMIMESERSSNVLKPIYLYTAQLPAYMRIVHHYDCREANYGRLEDASNNILSTLK